MQTAIIKTGQYLSAEIRKLKSTPVLYLVLFCAAFIITIVCLAHAMDVHAMARLNTNPWKRYFNGSIAVFSIFVISPFIVLLVSSVLYVEQKASAWKYLYTMPTGRGNIYMSKLLVICLILFSSALLLVFGLLLSAYALDYIYPEHEFRYYTPDVWNWLKILSRVLVAALGVVGLQYFLSTVFKHFLAPLGLGILGYILGFILSSFKTKIALFLPFTYPMLVHDFGAFSATQRTTIGDTWLTNVELYSLICFVVFVGLGFFYEKRRNVV